MTNNLLILIRKFCKAPLQHLPDFKGIETMRVIAVFRVITCSTSLTSKGLRHNVSRIIPRHHLQHLPDFKGIETRRIFVKTELRPCSTSLTSKGLRQSQPIFMFNPFLAAPPWLQRDWDTFSGYCPVGFVLAAPPWLQRDWDLPTTVQPILCNLQHLPDFKGIETERAFALFNWTWLAAPPWLQRDWDSSIRASTASSCLQHLPDFKGIHIRKPACKCLQAGFLYSVPTLQSF